MCTYTHKTTKKKKRNKNQNTEKEVIDDHKNKNKTKRKKRIVTTAPLALPPPPKKTTTTKTNPKQPQICRHSGQKWVLVAQGSVHFQGVYCLLWPWHSWGRPGWVSRLLLCCWGDEWFIFHAQVGHLRSCGSSFRMMGVAHLFIHSVLVGTVHRLVTILFVIKLFALAICQHENMAHCSLWDGASNSLSLPLYLQRQ